MSILEGLSLTASGLSSGFTISTGVQGDNAVCYLNILVSCITDIQ